MENIDTDNGIIAYVKNLFSKNSIASSLILFFSLNELNGKEEFNPPKVLKYAQNNVDDMVVKLFDLSLAYRICSMFPSREWCGKYGGFDMVVVPSMDGKTNITAKLIDFFKALVNPVSLDYLKEPFEKVQTVKPDLFWEEGNYVCGSFISQDQWEQFEA